MRRHLRWRVIRVTSNAFRRRFPFRAVARDAIRFHRHENVRRLTAWPGVMAIVAFDAGMLRMIKPRLRHPSIDQNWFRDHRGGVCDRLHFMTKRAPVE